MGYVAPVKNETAVQYGSRMVENEPAVARVAKVQATELPPIRDEDERNAYRREEEMYLMSKRREIEQKLYGKGKQLDLEA
ncbi:hypothetical protein [Salibacterium aidingense]|uniref:hypothetical protein n=1 Tax=Salibacterium aidingense TaxID=384933 RepID=UPI000424A72F|nr:hypothetical protein [Salibacterium aidingense]